MLLTLRNTAIKY